MVAAFSVDARAASPCSIDHAYPEVAALDVEQGRLVATLGRRFVPMGTGKGGEYAFPVFGREHPILAYSLEEGWVHAGVTSESPYRGMTKSACVEFTVDAPEFWKGVFPAEPSPEEREYFNQRVTDCSSDNEFIWGGVSFYAGEGSWGLGGVVKKTIATGEIDVIRPTGATNLSIGPVARFGGELFLGQFHDGECQGPAAGTGLKTLQFNTYAQNYELEPVSEVCGFAIRDFQEFGGSLWVATDFGVSRLTTGESSKWTNFVPDLESETLMREVECDSIYAELLSSEEFANTEGFDLGFAFQDLWKRLRNHRPEFVRRHLRELHGLAPR